MEDKKKSESPYNRMKTEDLIELVDSRKLNRVGLERKSELVELLCSDTSAVEKRGVKLKLFQAYRKLALSRNSDESFWTIARVSAMINGNHEILKADCRFGIVDPDSTLTFADKCPLIDVLLTKHYDNGSKHPLNISYKEAVGEKANFFISFAYADNFIDLVDALELYLETNSNEYPIDTTYFWFDTFVNNQWTASDQPFEFWANIFKEMVTEIGHTLCFLSPWENPTILTRVWCLLEIGYSPRISIILSKKQVATFQKLLREDIDSISVSLCKIKAENATSYIPEDRERIFRVIQSMEGGVHDFNIKVMGLIRDWISSSAKGVVTSSSRSSSSSSTGSVSGSDDNSITATQFEDMARFAIILQKQGNLKDARIWFQRAATGSERLLGPSGAMTLKILNSLAQVLFTEGEFKDAGEIWERVLSAKEQTLGRGHPETLNTVGGLAASFYELGRKEEAEELYRRALSGYTLAYGPDHASTLMAVNNLAIFLSKEGRLKESETLHEMALSIKERTLGPDHESTIRTVVNLACLLNTQGKHEEAKKLYKRALFVNERTLGLDSKDTLDVAHNLAVLLRGQGQLEEARKLFERVLIEYERSRGPGRDIVIALRCLADVLQELGRFEEATKLYERASSES